MTADDDKSLTDKLSEDVQDNVVRDDDPRGVGVGPEGEHLTDQVEPRDEDRMTPPGNDAEVVRTQSWVKGDERADPESEQQEDGGFR